MSARIERIEIDGFKSFAEHTDLQFSPGVSVFVGRNGSGKSNVTDALRWAFGEADVASLRVDREAELCFRRPDEAFASRPARVTVTVAVGMDDGPPGQVAGLPVVEADGTATRVTFSRWCDPWGGRGHEVHGEPSSDSGAEELVARAIPASLTTVIRQGEVGRLLWLRPAERGRLFYSMVSEREANAGSHAGRDRMRSELLLTALGPLDATDKDTAGRLLAALDLPLVQPPASPGAERAERTDVLIDALLRSGSGEEEYLAAIARVEARFGRFFTTLVPGGYVSLPLEPLDGLPYPGIGLDVVFPAKAKMPLSGLSGGQLVITGLCLALAFFLELPSAALILDEVEPALDEVMVRRLSALLKRVAEERQVVMVSHQRLTRDTADTVFQLERDARRGSHVRIRYQPRSLRAPGGGRRAPTPEPRA